MSITKRIIYVVVGTVLVVLGGLGIYGAIGVSGEYSSQPFFLLGQFILPIVPIYIANCFIYHWYLFTSSIL